MFMVWSIFWKKYNLAIIQRFSQRYPVLANEDMNQVYYNFISVVLLITNLKFKLYNWTLYYLKKNYKILTIQEHNLSDKYIFIVKKKDNKLLQDEKTTLKSLYSFKTLQKIFLWYPTVQ